MPRRNFFGQFRKFPPPEAAGSFESFKRVVIFIISCGGGCWAHNLSPLSGSMLQRSWIRSTHDNNDFALATINCVVRLCTGPLMTNQLNSVPESSRLILMSIFSSSEVKDVKTNDFLYFETDLEPNQSSCISPSFVYSICPTKSMNCLPRTASCNTCIIALSLPFNDRVDNSAGVYFCCNTNTA